MKRISKDLADKMVMDVLISLSKLNKLFGKQTYNSQ
jgi:hypothetical protein